MISLLFHSLIYLTVPFALLWPYSTPTALDHLFYRSQVTHLFTSVELLQTALQAVQTYKVDLNHVYLIEDEVEGQNCFASMISRVKDVGTPLIEVQPAQQNTLAYLNFSSGTSGLPKGVMISHGNLCFTYAQIAIRDYPRLKEPAIVESPCPA